jgi:hypothetical protein
MLLWSIFQNHLLALGLAPIIIVNGCGADAHDPGSPTNTFRGQNSVRPSPKNFLSTSLVKAPSAAKSKKPTLAQFELDYKAMKQWSEARIECTEITCHEI